MNVKHYKVVFCTWMGDYLTVGIILRQEDKENYVQRDCRGRLALGYLSLGIKGTSVLHTAAVGGEGDRRVLVWNKTLRYQAFKLKAKGSRFLQNRLVKAEQIEYSLENSPFSLPLPPSPSLPSSLPLSLSFFLSPSFLLNIACTSCFRDKPSELWCTTWA